MGHHSAAGRPAHAAKPSNQEVESTHQSHSQRAALRMVDQIKPSDGNSHTSHGYGTEYQSQRQKLAGIATVGYRAHQKLAQGIGYGIHSERQTQFALVHAQLFQHGYGHGKVLAHQIKGGITDECAREHLRPQAAIACIGRGTSGLGTERWGRE